MLKKLLKYDLRTTFKMALPFYVVTLIAAVVAFGLGFLPFGAIGGELASSSDVASVAVAIVTVVSVIFYFLLYILISVATTVFSFIPFVHFYRHLFTDEGYLTFTLPVTMSQHLLSKTITVYVVSLVGTIVGSGCVVIAGSSVAIASGMDAFIGLNSINFILEIFGLGGTAVSIVGLILIAVMSSFGSVTMMLLSITLGSVIFKKHRIIGSIGSYMVISAIFGIISTVFMVVVAIIGIVLGDATESVLGSINFILYAMAAGFGILGAVCYAITLKLFNKKLDLE